MPLGNNLNLRFKDSVFSRATFSLLFSLIASAAFPEGNEIKLLKQIEVLSTQETRPFLSTGEEILPTSPRWKEYEESLVQFPDALSCLKESEREKKFVDLLQIDWNAPKNLQGLNVCIFRIFTSLDSVDEMYVWLSFHEFNVRVLGRTRSDQPKTTNPKKYYGTHSVFAQWTVENYRKRRPDEFPMLVDLLLDTILSFLAAKSYSLSISLTNELEISSVFMNANSKLN